MKEKKCKGECGLVKPLKAFAIDNIKAQRRKIRCKPCQQIEIAKKKGDGFAERRRAKYRTFVVNPVPFTPAQCESLGISN